MEDIFNMFVNLFGEFINFLDSFKIIGTISILRLLIIVFLFSVAIKFLFNNNDRKGDKK